MRYGLPYKGSKNGIAEWVCDNLPNAQNFYDLFAGGCAITHCTMLRGKYKNYLINDISDYPQVFFDATKGKYRNETRWISREDFFSLKDNDAYIRYCWSFGNNGRSYLYSKEIEPWKKALHYARVFDDFSEFEKMGIELNSATSKNIIRHEKELKEKYIEWYCKEVLKSDIETETLRKNLTENIKRNFGKSQWEFPKLKQSLERLQRLQSLESLQRLQSLESLQSSYEDVKIKENSVIYCDIPYKGTDGYIGEFDYKRFYEWARSQKELVIISEYSMPNDFICIARIEKKQLFNSWRNSKKVVEGLFIPKHQEKLYIRKQTDLEQLLLDF